MGRTLTINLPTLIPRVLTPNRSRMAHWGTVAKAKSRIQQLAFLYARDAMESYRITTGQTWQPLEHAILFYTFYIRDLRQIMDDDNAIAGAKHIRDVLQTKTQGRVQGAGVYHDDRNVRTGGITWKVDKERTPLTIIEVREPEVNNKGAKGRKEPSSKGIAG